MIETKSDDLFPVTHSILSASALQSRRFQPTRGIEFLHEWEARYLDRDT
jgi:hypothetical protein